MDEKNCLNCDKPLPPKARFCPSCGQKNNNGKIGMKDLLKEFWSHLSHLDNKFIKAIWQLFIPAKVTIEFFKGRHKRYPQPVQFFFIVMFFFLLFFNKTFNKNDFGFNNTRGNFSLTFGPSAEKLVTQEDVKQKNLRNDIYKEILEKYDSLPPSEQSNSGKAILDSVLKVVKGRSGTDRLMPGDSLIISLFYQDANIATADLSTLSPGEIIERYQIHNWLDKFFLKQGIRSFRNPEGLIHTYLGSIAWTILVLIGLMSGILALLYRRQKRYYVEHFVFLMHQHSAAFMGITIWFILSLLGLKGIFWIAIFPAIGIHLLFSMRNYYGQSMGVTILKWILYLIIYVAGFLSLLVVSLLLSFMLF